MWKREHHDLPYAPSQAVVLRDYYKIIGVEAEVNKIRLLTVENERYSARQVAIFMLSKDPPGFVDNAFNFSVYIGSVELTINNGMQAGERRYVDVFYNP